MKSLHRCLKNKHLQFICLSCNIILSCFLFCSAKLVARQGNKGLAEDRIEIEETPIGDENQVVFIHCTTS